MNSYKEVYDENKIIAQLMKSLEEKDGKIAMLKSEVKVVYLVFVLNNNNTLLSN